MRIVCITLVSAALCLPISVAAAQAPTDRVTFGGNAVVRHGEVVADLVTMGGDAIVEGHVTGDVVTMGGNLTVMPTGKVSGDLVTMGGSMTVHPGASVNGATVLGQDIPTSPGFGDGAHGPLQGLVHGLGKLLSSLLSYVMLFVLGLILMGVTRERLDALQVVMVRCPFRALGTGILGFLGTVVGIVILCITIIGIPAAVVLAIALPFAIYVGMAAAASVLGAALPIRALSDRPVLQLGAGVLALFVASLVPVVGPIAIATTALVGLGSLFITRFDKTASLDLGEEPTPAGPYRTQAA